MKTNPFDDFIAAQSTYYPRGATVDVVIRNARVSSRHVQDKRLFLQLAERNDVHVPLPLPPSVTVRVHGNEPTDRSLRDDLAALLTEWVMGEDDTHCGADAVLTLVARAIEHRADIEEYRGTGYTDGWLDVADHLKGQVVVQPEAASPLSDRSIGDRAVEANDRPQSTIVEPEAAYNRRSTTLPHRQILGPDVPDEVEEDIAGRKAARAEHDARAMRPVTAIEPLRLMTTGRPGKWSPLNCMVLTGTDWTVLADWCPATATHHVTVTQAFGGVESPTATTVCPDHLMAVMAMPGFVIATRIGGQS